MAAIALGFASLLADPLMYGFYGVLVPAALVLAIKRPEFFAMLPVVLCVMANSRTGLFAQAIHLTLQPWPPSYWLLWHRFSD